MQWIRIRPQGRGTGLIPPQGKFMLQALRLCSTTVEPAINPGAAATEPWATAAWSPCSQQEPVPQSLESEKKGQRSNKDTAQHSTTNTDLCTTATAPTLEPTSRSCWKPVCSREKPDVRKRKHREPPPPRPRLAATRREKACTQQ